jgi:hypothetical protein
LGCRDVSVHSEAVTLAATYRILNGFGLGSGCRSHVCEYVMLSAVHPADERKMDQERLVEVGALLYLSPLRGVCGSSKHDLGNRFNLPCAKRLVKCQFTCFMLLEFQGEITAISSDRRSALETRSPRVAALRSEKVTGSRVYGSPDSQEGRDIQSTGEGGQEAQHDGG